MFSIQTSHEQGLAYKGKSTDEGYGYRMPIYWVFKLLSEQRGELLVESLLHGDNAIAAPKTGLYRDPKYSFQRVSHCASVSHGVAGNGDKLYLALLNKDARQRVQIRINIRDWQPRTEFEVHEVRAESYLAENTIDKPDTVTLSGPRVEQAGDDAGAMTFLLKPNTLAVLRFDRDSAGANLK
ncbi:MAG: hypothetical protein GY878_31290 [Fuerstiella sp.]|nr:hypothetical protein [Fuerstiella sp.]